MKVRRKSIKRQLQSLAHDYMRQNDLDEIDLDEVTDWLIRTDQYKRKPITLHQQCKLDLARALKAERFTDENGNEIRRNHAIRIKSKDSSQQMVLWVDIKTAKPKPMRLSLQQRRLAILADCYRHSLDTEWYNTDLQNGIRSGRTRP